MALLKSVLTAYLDDMRGAVLWKLDGLSERQARTPLTPTGSTLLGIVKHLGAVEFGYFGLAFDRPTAEPMAQMDAAVWEDNADMWATVEQDKASVEAFYRRAIAHANTTIAGLDLDSPGLVPWWPADRQAVTLGRVLVHMLAETARHAGHLDILREQLDGRVGQDAAHSGVPAHDDAWWAAYIANLVELAAQAPD
jgi:hypothetical protein